MSYSFFHEKAQRPSEAEIERTLGKALLLWQKLAAYLQSLKSVGELRYLYGKGYGWGFRHVQKGKLIVALYPNEGYFVTQIILSQKQLEALDPAGLGRSVQNALEAANTYAEGKWLFVKTEKERTIEEIKYLMELKVGFVGQRALDRNRKKAG